MLAQAALEKTDEKIAWTTGLARDVLGGVGVDIGQLPPFFIYSALAVAVWLLVLALARWVWFLWREWKPDK